ncbi:MAG: hypothetical protein ACYTKD_18110 [Planctomycetota bacterium]|jgi:hypothetical protein
MSTPLARSVLDFLHSNIRDGLDSLRTARAFVRGLEGLTSTEKLFLEAALSKAKILEEFHRRFVNSRSGMRSPCLVHPAGRVRLGRNSRASG